MERNSDDRLVGARWSSATKCVRQGVYSALGAIPSPRSAHVEGMLERGHDLEAVYHRRLAERYSGPIVRELAIPWGMPGWELHLDFLLPELDRQHLEVKSAVNIDTVPGPPVEINGVTTKAPILQVVGAAVFDRDGGTANVAVISPTTYMHNEFPVTITDDLAGVAIEIAERVRRAVETGELPERVCTVPSDAISRFCPFQDTCFADWEPVEQIVTDGPVAILADRLRKAEERFAELGRDQKEAKAERDELRRQMRDYTKPGLEYVLGGVRVRRTVSKGRRTFKLADAIATGALRKEQIDGPLTPLGNFVSTAEEGERWTVGDPVEDEAES